MIEVLSGGLLTTIQDLGRYGYRKYGVPLSGAMDTYSAKMGNQILGNSPESPVLEITMVGPILKFNESCAICLAGADLSPKLDSNPIGIGVEIHVEAGQILRFGKLKSGLRVYLAIKGGFHSEMVLGSASFYPNITLQHQIEKGDYLYFNRVNREVKQTNSKIKYSPEHIELLKIEVEKGPDFDLLSEHHQTQLFSSEFKISNESNRMGYRLSSDTELVGGEIITAPVQPGTVQLTPSGKLIVLGRDAQTTGGYFRVLQLTAGAQNALAQKQIGDEIQFFLED